MSLTSYRTAPPRGNWCRGFGGLVLVLGLGSGIAGFWFVCPLFGGPGGDLLSHALRRSTIGAKGFHGRVRDGIGCLAPCHSHQAPETEAPKTEDGETEGYGSDRHTGGSLAEKARGLI